MTIHKAAHTYYVAVLPYYVVLQKSMLLEKKAWYDTLLEVEAKAEYYATCCQLWVTSSRFKIKPTLY